MTTRRKMFEVCFWVSDILFGIGIWIGENIFLLPRKQARKFGYVMAIPAEIGCAISWDLPYYKGLNLPWA